MAASGMKMTLWIWPAGMFPRRLLFYFKAKNLPTHILHKLQIIPVEIDTQRGTLKALPGYEARPDGYSLPTLRLLHENGETTMISQSSSILEYFEELFPSRDGYIGLSGHDAEHRAQMRDVVFQMNEVFIWTNVYLRHTTEISRHWTGMLQQEQSLSAASDARKQVNILTQKLERYVENLIGTEDMTSVVGGDGPNLADFNLIAARAYIEEMYDWDIFEGRNLLADWYLRYQKSQWWIDPPAMEEFGQGVFDSLFVAE